MGNRISFCFSNKGEKSVVFFSHWDGKELLDTVEGYLKGLKKYLQDTGYADSMPLGTLEPCTVMVDFIKNGLEDYGRVTGNYYIVPDESDGDNSDNGHFEIELSEFMETDWEEIKELLKGGEDNE